MHQAFPNWETQNIFKMHSIISSKRKKQQNKHAPSLVIYAIVKMINALLWLLSVIGYIYWIFLPLHIPLFINAILFS